MPFNKSKALEEAAKLVSQRKLSQAIKVYLAIVEQDPADLSLLNTVGDLCVRDGNIPGALRQYYKLAAAYAHEGFSLKAIAIYKKIAKLDARSADPLIKLAELYSSQGLSHEAREQYAQALAFCHSHSLPEKAVEILGKLIAQDPENAGYRVRLGEFHEAAGRTREAALAYIEAAEIAHRQKNATVTNAALGKASHLDPHNARVLLLEARMAVESGRFEDAGKLLAGAPELKASREARLILLESCLGAQKLDEAVAVTLEIYRGDPGNFEAVERFTSSCLQANNPDAALEPLGAIADLALERQQAGALISNLRRILQAQPRHVSTLELIHAIYERAGGARHGSELLEELGGAFARAGQWASAEKAYRQLLEHTGDNPQWEALLKEALANQGKAWEEAETAEASPAPEPVREPAVEKSAPPLAPLPEPLTTTPASETSPPAAPDREIEIDFSSEWKEYTAVHAAKAEPEAPTPAPAPAPALEEETSEIQFYLEYGFFAEARASLEKLEAAYLGHPELAELRQRVEEAQGPEVEAPPIAGAPLEPFEPSTIEGRETGFPAASAQDETDLFTDFAASPGPVEASVEFSPPGAPADQIQGKNLIEELKLDLEKSFAEPPVTQASPLAEGQAGLGSAADADSFTTAFHDLLAELELEQQEDSAQDTPQAHYNLGVAFREMGLLDEAIGEFQKAVRGADKQNLPPRFLEACSLLGACFMEKGMHAIAVRWYLRALEAPGLDEETVLALNYDLGLAYEGSGDAKSALEKFSEVYSLNIDYRDVAEKIHSLQHKQR